MPPLVAFSTLACPGWGWSQLLEHVRPYGYDGIECRMLRGDTDLLAQPEFQPSQRATRLRETQNAGWQVAGLASSVRFDYPSAAACAEQVEIGRRYLDLARELGATFVRVFGDVLPPSADPGRDTVFGQIVCGLEALGKHGEQTGVRVLIETHGDFSDTHLLYDLLKWVESGAVGTVWDTHHPWRFHGEPLAESYQRLAPWVWHTHWKDSVTIPPSAQAARHAQLAADVSRLMSSGHKHADYALFGGGEFPILECLRILKQAGYQGWYSLECEKAWHPDLAEPELALPLFAPKLRELWAVLAVPAGGG